jgi:hypothetical protein
MRPFALMLLLAACGAEMTPEMTMTGDDAGPVDAGQTVTVSPDDGGRVPYDSGYGPVRVCDERCSDGCKATYAAAFAAAMDGGAQCAALCEADGGALGVCTDACTFVGGNPANGAGVYTQEVDMAAVAEDVCIYSCGCPL